MNITISNLILKWCFSILTSNLVYYKTNKISMYLVDYVQMSSHSRYILVNMEIDKLWINVYTRINWFLIWNLIFKINYIKKNLSKPLHIRFLNMVWDRIWNNALMSILWVFIRQASNLFHQILLNSAEQFYTHLLKENSEFLSKLVCHDDLSLCCYSQHFCKLKIHLCYKKFWI
jgi:hypothetical protein